MARKFLKIVGIVFLVLVLLVAALFGFLTITEYKPEDTEPVEIVGSGAGSYTPGVELTLVTWNIGYGALGDNADFFMDGGSSVMTADKNRLHANLENIKSTLTDINPDILLLQEVDVNAKRSYKTNETAVIQEAFPNYSSSFAANYKVAYVPYPVPPIGQVESGIETLTSASITEATRIQLPCPFSWPVRLANLKRCLLVTRIPLRNSDKELVVVNLHLEAFDNGEGKIAQTEMLQSFLETEAEKGNYVIAGGDFNQTFPGEAASLYPAYDGCWQPGTLHDDAFRDFTILTDASTPTCRSLDQAYDTAEDKDNFQYYVIDGFILSSNVIVTSCETKDLEFQASDHNPVVLKFYLDLGFDLP